MMKLRNLFTGQQEELTVGSSIGKVLWVVVSVILFAAGQQLLGIIGNRTKLDTTIDPIISSPAAAYSGPYYNVF